MRNDPTKYKNRYRIDSNRLRNWDYGSPGYYFVTVCTTGKKEWFGEIEEGEMKHSDIGLMVQRYWQEIPHHFDHVEIDQFVVMPNHVHGIVVILDHDRRDAINRVSTNGGVTTSYNPMGTQSLGEIIRWYKGRCSFELRKKIQYMNFSWQPRYYDRVIRDDTELEKIREYIYMNPNNWGLDKDNPINK